MSTKKIHPSQLTAPRAVAQSFLATGGYYFNDSTFRMRDARTFLKALRELGFVVVPKTKRPS